MIRVPIESLSRMRILVFTFEFPPAIGGVETMTCQLSRHLDCLGVPVTVLAPKTPGDIEFDSSQRFSVKRFVLGNSDSLLAKSMQKLDLIRTLRQTIAEMKADCVLCTSWDPCAYIAYLAEMVPPRIPYFVIAHGMELMQLPRAFVARLAKAWLRQMTLLRARRVFAVSEYTRARVLALGVPFERVTVVPNGVESRSDKDIGSNPHGKEGARILTTVSRLVWRKGHDTVLYALPRILAQVPNVIYRIVGTGPECERLKKLTRTLGLEPYVEFYGEVRDQERERLLQECDVFVFPSRQTPTDFEGFGIAVIEAMQHAKPVVVTHAGGVPEIVDDGRTGLVVEPDAPEALARAILTLLYNPTRAAQIGEAARAVVQTRYDWDTIAQLYLRAMTASLEVT
jgi:phosphatidyl-myo-inositol dimannoside synthase